MNRKDSNKYTMTYLQNRPLNVFLLRYRSDHNNSTVNSIAVSQYGRLKANTVNNQGRIVSCSE